MNEVSLWPPNRLPLPFCVTAEVSPRKEVAQIVVDDNFPKGEVVKYFPNQEYGFVKIASGAEIFFHLEEMNIVGKKSADEIKVGLTVGYDLVHSGRDLHVKKMKVY